MMRHRLTSRFYDGRLLYAYGQDQHQGKRPYQEDYFGLNVPETEADFKRLGLFFVLADGMGGTAKGDLASIMAVEGMIKHFRDFVQESLPEALNAAITKTNDDIYQKALSDKKYWKMGTTCVAVALRNGELYFVSAGDSHIYLLSDGYFRRLNEDHSVGEELDKKVKAGLMSQAEASSVPGRSKLVSSLGDKAISKVDISRFPLKLKKGDKVIICSDGLYAYLEKAKIAKIVSSLPPQNASEKLIAETLALGYEDQDNISIQIIEVLGEATAPQVKAFFRDRGRLRPTVPVATRISPERVVAAVFLMAVLLAVGFFAGHIYTLNQRMVILEKEKKLQKEELAKQKKEMDLLKDKLISLEDDHDKLSMEKRLYQMYLQTARSTNKKPGDGRIVTPDKKEEIVPEIINPKNAKRFLDSIQSLKGIPVKEMAKIKKDLGEEIKRQKGEAPDPAKDNQNKNLK